MILARRAAFSSCSEEMVGGSGSGLGFSDSLFWLLLLSASSLILIGVGSLGGGFGLAVSVVVVVVVDVGLRRLLPRVRQAKQQLKTHASFFSVFSISVFSTSASFEGTITPCFFFNV